MMKMLPHCCKKNAASLSRARGLRLSIYFYVLILFWTLTLIGGQITPPPPIGGKPVISDNRIWYLNHIPERCRPPIIDRFNGGGIINDSRALIKAHNPHIIRGNIEITPRGCLYIEPGCILKFAPGMGMIVNGTLIARGSYDPGGRITMTKAEGEDLGKPSGNWQDDARLSMGNTTRDGRLDLKFKYKWRAVCTNYNNFTAIDANVTCRHLGFLKGNFTYHSFARNLTDYILWEKPDCKGGENNLFDCPGAVNMQIGRHICDGQEVIGFECEGLRPGLALDHWRSIEFYNSSTEPRYQLLDNKRVYMNESLSFLEYLDISYTGLDTFHGKTSEPNIFYQKAAISASPYVPMMNNITIRYSAYDALNLTEVVSPIHIANSTISHNRGYGMFIQSSIGRTLVNMTEVNNNWGDGIKFYISNLTIFDFRIKFPPEKSFCAQVNTEDVTYPFFQHMDLVQVDGGQATSVAIGGNCERSFSTSPNMKITVHFMIIERDPAANGTLTFMESGYPNIVFNIENGSFPESYTSKTNRISVRFVYRIPQNKICKVLLSCIRFLMQFTSDYDVDEEFRLIMSSVHDNIGYGVNIQDMRSKIRISNETMIYNNHFGAGVLVYKGAGEIIINGTRISNNADAGVNVTYSGGYQLYNNTQFISNKGYGLITEYSRINRTRFESRNIIEIVRAQFMWNELIGLRMGNYCNGGEILVNESYFGFNYDEAFEYLSCNRSTMFKTKLKITFNIFDNNFRHAILMRPLLNTDGLITNNTFVNHTLATIRIDNGYDLLISRWYRDFPVSFNMFENNFKENTGRYVANFRLTQNSAVQYLDCKFNYFQNNQINDSFMYLNSRSRANAVIVVSSTNIRLKRNYIDNPESVRELATHLVDPSISINAEENYWGIDINAQADYAKVYKGIFDQDERFNLAKIDFHPSLRTSRLYDDFLSTNVPEYVWKFQRGNNIGGVLEDTLFTVRSGQTFYVDKDIYVMKDKKLILEPNSILKFGPSIGMVVHGLLKADGKVLGSPVILDIDDDSSEFVPMENRTTNIRLVDGENEFEGRLEVEINDQWGTVCNDGWIEENSLLVCQQLGLALNRDYPLARVQRRAPDSTPVLMNWVSCDETDVDFTKCRSVNEDAPTCSHDKDVYIKCFKPTWAGITLAAAYRHDQNTPMQDESQIRHVKIFNAGLLDPDTGTLTPALRIDYNYYQISHLTVNNSMSDGVFISYAHPYLNNFIEYLTSINNAGNGIVTKSPRLLLNHSRIDNNLKAGFLYDPFFTEYDVLLIRNMIYPTRRISMFEVPQRILTQEGQIMFLICSPGNSIEVKEYIVEVKGSGSFSKLTLQVLDYLPIESAEKVIVYDSGQSAISSPNTRRWEIEKDLVDFPIQSAGSILTIQLKLNGQLSGRLAFAVIYTSTYQAPPWLITAVTNTSFTGNDQGIVTKHYNSPSNRRLELFHRHKVEEIYFKDLKVLQTVRHAMHMPSVTKFTEDYIPTYEDMTKAERVAKIIYTVFQSIFMNNSYGILAEHNHVDFANNVWQWKIDHVVMMGTRQGGVEIEVPRVNDETEREIHAVRLVDSTFQDNHNFAFTVAGYFALVDISRNLFTNNYCLLGLVSLKGMEKNLTIISNQIRTNVGRYMIDIDIWSHSEYFTELIGRIDLNDIIDNRYEGVEPPGAAYSPKTYAVGVKGVQTLGGNRNIFVNKNLGYEFVAGTYALTLNKTMDLTLNYWGVVDQPSIRRRIFDFDDWNNYVIAEFFPYLSIPDRNSTPTTGIREEIYLDTNHLGGRVEKSQALMEIGKPYIVKSDLTIMPGVTLTIPPGTELQFLPNVGILVLGRLVANGLAYSRIKMRPLQPGVIATSTLKRRDLDIAPVWSNYGRRKRDYNIEPTKRVKRATANLRLRGDGTLFKNAGFLEMYNSTTKTWNMMCDSQFNEKTAEVVCRELGKETINVKVRFTHLYDYYIYGKPQYFRKEFWYNIYNCRGDETSLSQCITRYNYNILSCVFAANYTFVTCGDRNLDQKLDYWGNIRFATHIYEEQPLQADIGLDHSSLTYVDIEGAGYLHGEKVGAIQTTYTTPIFSNINITNCAENGYDIIAPRQNLNIQFQNISRNLGYGVNVLVLNGESSTRQSSFLPFGLNTMPYNVYGLVDICRLEKQIFLETRMILYYKYGQQQRDCVKIISSRKNVGLRFLQINLFQEDFTRNMIEIFDGTDVSESSRIGRILANSSDTDIQKLYLTTSNTMSVHVHASVSHGTYGFIAEVVKMPLAGLTYPNSEFTHKIQNAEIRKNEDGAIQYKNVGETTPSLFIEHCYMSENGFSILNLTSPPTIDISLQSTITFRFSHNQISYNSGGMYLFAHTSAINSALRGNVTNNMFAFGRNGEALNISGHYFQRLMLHQNYFYNYTAGDFRDVVHIKNVVVNLTHNYILKNNGHYILHIYNNDDSTESQLYARNGIYDNNATALRESTIKIGQGRPKFTYNYLVNNLNDFEVETYPKPQLDTRNIDAKDNWWGSERQAYINGKIFDVSDDINLVQVDFWPAIIDNRSMVEANCLPGWVYDNKRCYRYMGGAVPYDRAKEFCQLHGAFLAEARDREGFFNYLMRLMLIDQTWAPRVWVMSDISRSRCAAFEKTYLVYEQDCARLYYPFICETDPQVTAPTELIDAINAMIIGLSVGIGSVIIIIIIIVVILWCIKSKRREKERFERTASIRSSINNLNKINGSLRGTRSTLTVLSEGMSKRRLDDLDDRSVATSVAKYSHNSASSDDMAESVSSGFEAVVVPQQQQQQRLQQQRPQQQQMLRPQQQQQRAPQQQLPQRPPQQAQTSGRPVHSLRPDRSKPMGRNQATAGLAETNRYKSENRARDDRKEFDEESSDDSVNKDDFDSDSDSTFDEDEEDEQEKRIEGKSQGRLVQKPIPPVKPTSARLAREDSMDSDSSAQQSNSSHSVSSFTDPILTPTKNIFPPRSTSKDNLDSRVHQSLPEASYPVTAPRPKPAPPSRSRVEEIKQPLVSDHGRWSPTSTDSQGSQQGAHRLYTNQPGPQQPDYDSVYNSKPNLYKNIQGSSQSSSRGPLYDSVYDGTPSNGSKSSERYEPMEYRNEYGVDQAPDTDYMPRNMGGNTFGRNPLAPSKMPNDYRGASVSDSVSASLPSDANFMPRKAQHAAISSRLEPSLPSKSGSSVGPSLDRSYQNQNFPHGSRDNLNSLPRPPPYSDTMMNPSRSQSRDKLNQNYRGSRENLDEPPPYFPGSAAVSLNSGSSNVLYLNSGARPKKHESVETEI
ncbi:protein bark beetle [Biomphalaria pfeifferi]|uniref:Protein bark beetle n=1 Tax=Biomphalaria pfeifferi TaxID=112525 RepID=A0AAD8B9P3_BIOPF|nr:protein bark beetle [Biomphalaria pfeifferi]